MSHGSTEIFHDTMIFLDGQLTEGDLDAAVRLKLPARGFEEELAELYEQFQRSEYSFGYIAEQLGFTTWALYALLERRGLRTTNL